jgi:hypothetical protein
MVKKIKAFFGIPTYEVGTILQPNPMETSIKVWKNRYIVLSRPKKLRMYDKMSNNIVITDYPIKNVKETGTYSYNSLRRSFNTIGFDKTAGVLYGTPNKD